MRRLKWLLPVLLIAAGVSLYGRLEWAVEDLSDSRRLACDEKIYAALMEEQEHILMVGYDLTPEELSETWNHTVYENADLFFIADRYEYVLIGDRVIYVTPQYAVSGDELEEARSVYDDALSAILATVDPAWSDLETALYLHDYLCMHYAYDESVSRYSAYEMLTDGTGVCQAYTLIYTALLQACGIDCSYVVSRDMNHAWNVVTLDGQKYNVDITYDDPTADRLGRAVHSNFLLSDAALSASHSFTDSEGFGQCTDPTYDNAIWQTASSGFVPVGEDFYFISKGTIRRWNGGSDSDPVLTIYATWFTDRGDGSYWEGNHSTLWADGDRLLYNTPNRIMALDPDSGSVRTAYTYSGSGSIYGFTYDGAVLTLQVSDSPNEYGELVTAEIEG